MWHALVPKCGFAAKMGDLGAANLYVNYWYARTAKVLPVAGGGGRVVY